MRIEEHINQDPENLIVTLLNTAQGTVWTSSGLVSDFFRRERFRQAVESAAARC